MDARVSLAVFSFLVLVAVLVYFLRNGSERSQRRDLFLALILSTMVLLVCSGLTWTIDGHAGSLVRWTLIGSSAIYFALHPVVCTLWMGYLRAWLPTDSLSPGVVRVRGLLMTASLVAAVLSTLACIVNLFIPLFFWVDDDNFYHRGLYFPWSVVLSSVPLVAAGVYLATARGDRGQKLRTAALACSIPPTAAAVFQILSFGVEVLWPAVTLAILILYLGLEAENSGLDFLTKLKNRRAFEHDLARRLRDPRGRLLVLLIDLDRFKQINDQWGHAEGDRALIAAADVLQGALHHNDGIARLGGDEFAVVLALDPSGPEAVVTHLHRRFEDWNRASGTPWQLIPSIGMAVAEPSRPVSGAELLAQADQAMYQAKATRRGQTEPAWTPA